ncbi:hypothetical protein POTOM_025779 [Populus tomentosa]|uniref:Uncharacterized protein n=1 Tax=Populus tomentosa TaxID=118781 RepID=A0A8X7ZJ97_POPTO|nr:hypothetical protein POTOM_025779 [Populus tomentosa]
MEMVSMSSCLLSINGNFLLSSQYPSRPPTLVKWGFRMDQDGSSVTKRIKSQAFRILANPNELTLKQSYSDILQSRCELVDRKHSRDVSAVAYLCFKSHGIVLPNKLQDDANLPSIRLLGILSYSSIAHFRVSGNSNPMKEVIMVDPLEAKRLAAIQMKEIQRRERFKRRRQIEAINGAWAMIGLTAGLVIEGHTGKSILEQVKSAPIDCIQFRSPKISSIVNIIFVVSIMEASVKSFLDVIPVHKSPMASLQFAYAVPNSPTWSFLKHSGPWENGKLLCRMLAPSQFAVTLLDLGFCDFLAIFHHYGLTMGLISMAHETTRLSLSAKAVYFKAFTAASSTFPCIKARSGFCRLSKQSLSRRLESKPTFQSPLSMQLNLSWTSDAPTPASGRQIFNNMIAQKLK